MFLKGKDILKKYFLFYSLNIDVVGGDEALSWYGHLVTTKALAREKARVPRTASHGAALPLNFLHVSKFLIG